MTITLISPHLKYSIEGQNLKGLLAINAFFSDSMSLSFAETTYSILPTECCAYSFVSCQVSEKSNG